MRRPRLSEEDREALMQEIYELKIREIQYERKKRLFNRFYRKSSFFRAMWMIRIVYIVLFFVIVLSDSISNGYTEEVVSYQKSESYRTHSRHGGHYKGILDFKTNKNNYTSVLTDETIPEISEGDTLLIERDIFNKSIYFTKNDWDYKYPITSYFDDIFFYINILLLFFILVSLTFNDGLFKYNNKVLIFIATNIAIASSLYLLNRLYYVIFG